MYYVFCDVTHNLILTQKLSHLLYLCDVNIFDFSRKITLLNEIQKIFWNFLIYFNLIYGLFTMKSIINF